MHIGPQRSVEIIPLIEDWLNWFSNYSGSVLKLEEGGTEKGEGEGVILAFVRE